MPRRHRICLGESFSPVAAFLLLSVFFLVPAFSAHASDAAKGVSTVNFVLPLMKPVVEPATYPDRGLHFADPIDTGKARMTSGYGWRMHPVLKTKKMHRGVDYAAPKGTPVYATEDGIVGMAAWRGNYGKLVTVKHSDTIETYYAHLSGFAPGIRPGVGVKKGEVIGYVGMTGLATGNHLYYEVVVDNERLDPLADDLNEQVNVLAAKVERPAGQVAETRGLIEAR
ncbi:MAG: M23 family metallopeptidase [Alphaproteobacteria bacterium]|uniref:M23 family metallopeptidase n=1 Tax=Parvibaculum sp. TaxID=2024848 RepID=UPI0032EED14E